MISVYVGDSLGWLLCVVRIDDRANGEQKYSQRFIIIKCRPAERNWLSAGAAKNRISKEMQLCVRRLFWFRFGSSLIFSHSVVFQISRRAFIVSPHTALISHRQRASVCVRLEQNRRIETSVWRMRPCVCVCVYFHIFHEWSSTATMVVWIHMQWRT